jgi:hypothetical protein
MVTTTASFCQHYCQSDLTVIKVSAALQCSPTVCKNNRGLGLLTFFYLIDEPGVLH